MKRFRSRLFRVAAILVPLATCVSAGSAQTKYLIEFRDKGIRPECFAPGTTEYNNAEASLSRVCLLRRSEALDLPETQCVTLEDVAVCSRYLDSLRSLGICIETALKWENAVTARLTATQRAAVQHLRFVRAVVPVRSGVYLSIPQPVSTLKAPVAARAQSLLAGDTSVGYDSIIYHYGLAQPQLDRINVWPLHAMGFDGDGVLLGFLDVGFRWRENPVFHRLKVQSEYDYIFHDSVTENQAGQDSSYQDGHGTQTLSCATAYLPDTLMGPAYAATLMLAKTEWIPSEHHIEEDNYAKALEDMEAQGVDITSSSVGYFGFDAPDTSYTYTDMNGRTSITARAVQRATKLGVLVVTAMGNGGASGYPYVITPADADSILAVGALDLNDTIAGFSSRGPTSDGRIKPDICSPGVGDWTQLRDGGFGQATGTSFATPLVAGACCLIKQSHPLATAQQIRRAVMATGRNASHPDTAYGWGEINAYAAALELGTIVHIMHAKVDTVANIVVGAASKRGVKNVELRYFGDSDIFPHTANFHLVADSLIYAITMPVTTVGSRMYYQVTVTDSAGKSVTEPPARWDTAMLPPKSAVHGTVEAPSLQVSVFPNPAATECRISANVTGTFDIVNQLGREVYRSSSKMAEAFTLPTSMLSNGFYYLRFFASDGTSAIKPLVISH